MPPTFREINFEFDGEVPRHIEEDTHGKERDLTKFALIGEMPHDAHFYGLATDIDDLPTAETLKAARERHLATRPRNTDDAMQAHIVHILHPVF
jgi:hypothetical protein